ncbi:MAG: hypothetical protein MHMPM18_001182 [Marteilia pararefringens]
MSSIPKSSPSTPTAPNPSPISHETPHEKNISDDKEEDTAISSINTSGENSPQKFADENIENRSARENESKSETNKVKNRMRTDDLMYIIASVTELSIVVIPDQLWLIK